MGKTTKRVPLGELQNRGLNRQNASTNAAQKTAKVLKPTQSSKTIKPRVDTRWKGQPLANTVKETAPKAKKNQVLVKNNIKIDKAKASSKEKNLPKKPLIKSKPLPKDSPIKAPSASPEPIRDVDAEDQGKLHLVPEYVNDIFRHLSRLEEKHPIVEDHLAGQKEVTPRMRAMLINWINDIHLHFHLTTEIYHLTVGIIDRYLQVVKDTKRENLQLVGTTALFVASKYEELFAPTIEHLVYVTDNTYTAWQIIEMERRILRAIEFNISFPVSITFLRRFSKVAQAEAEHHNMAKYFIELATLEYKLASCRPSEIAAASLLLSLLLLRETYPLGKGPQDRLWTATLEFYTRYSACHLQPIFIQIAKLARKAPKAKFKEVYKKYSREKFQKISMRKELSGSLIDSIIGSEIGEVGFN